MRDESGEERRKYFRLNKVLPAHFTPAGADREADPSQKERIFVVDISAGGFRATTHRPMEINALLKAEIYIDRHKPVLAECRVVWQRDLSIPDMHEVGFEFTEIEQSQWKRLVDFIVEERARATRQQPVTWQLEKGYLNRPIGGE